MSKFKGEKIQFKHLALMLTVIFMGVKINALSQDKLKCSANELSVKNCDIKSKTYKFHLSKDSIRVFDGARHNVTDFPLKEHIEWKSIEFKQINQRNIIELKIWTDTKNSAVVQSLHWVLVEFINDKATLRLNQIIQKRKPKPGDKETFIYDPILSHKLEKQDASQIAWRAGRFSGSF